MSEASAVQSFFRGCGIFITGATGFLGMGLVEKLLRCCPDSGPIFLLVRPKKEKSIQERLEEVTKNKVFEVLRESQGPDVFSKLVAIPGDVGEEGLGLSDADRKRLIENVSIVFHSAATLDFEASLLPAVQINLRGTRAIVRLCQQMPKLKVLLHVSSAYVNCVRSETTEQLYPADHDPDTVIQQTMDTTDEKALEALSMRLLGDHPNTYTFTKLLAEHVVASAAPKIPVAIVRPSMITAALKEPVPGWISSTNGPSGFLMGAARGVVRRLPMGAGLIYDYIPVDMVINEMLVAACNTGTNKPPQVAIYHCTTSTQRPFSWSLIQEELPTLLHKYPLKGAVWYPNLKMLHSLSHFRLSSIFVHFFPAYVLDFILRLTGGRAILVRMHTRVNSSLGRLQYFIFNEWKFHNDNTQALARALSPQDKARFDFDVGVIQWGPYFDIMAQGVRRYMNKEEERTLPAARRKQNILAVLHYALLGGWHCLAYYLAYALTGDQTLALVALPLTFFFLNYL